MWVSSWATGQAARLVLVLAAGIAVRVALVPLTRGQDFEVWDVASTATLQGIDIYAHHPAYPGGPYAYFPLFVYLELPPQWLAEHTGISFTVLGKVPILAGDVACALVLAGELRDRTASNRAVLLGTSLFFLNPLVLYNGAFYGRFDTVALALLLFAVRLLRKSKRSAGLWYGLAIAAKTFPAFVLPGIVRDARGRRLWLVITPLQFFWCCRRPTYRPGARCRPEIAVYDAAKAPGRAVLANAFHWHARDPDVAACQLWAARLVPVGRRAAGAGAGTRPVHPRDARPVSRMQQGGVGAIPALADAVAGARSGRPRASARRQSHSSRPPR